MSTLSKNEKVDLRIRRTRQCLHDAFVSLIQEKPYDEVSITDITERANLSRNTFYLHYKNKEELLASIIGKFVEDSTQQLDIRHFAKLMQANKVSLSEYLVNYPHFETLFQLTKRQPLLMQLALSHLGIGLHGKLEECLTPLVKQFGKSLNLLEKHKEQLELAQTYINGGMLALLAKGVQNSDEYDLDSLEKLSLRLTNAIIKEIMIEENQ